jgi:hypothetical protein
MSIIVLSVLKLADTRQRLREQNLLQPGNDVREIEDCSCSICIAGADWMGEWLKRQRATVKRCDGSWIKTLWLAETLELRKSRIEEIDHARFEAGRRGCVLPE